MAMIPSPARGVYTRRAWPSRSSQRLRPVRSSSDSSPFHGRRRPTGTAAGPGRGLPEPHADAALGGFSESRIRPRSLARRGDGRAGDAMGSRAEPRTPPANSPGRDEFRALQDRVPEDPRFERADPVPAENRRPVLQLLARRATTSAAFGGGRRSTNTASPTPAWEWCSTSTRWGRRKRRTGSGTGASLSPGRRPLPGLPFSRRRRRDGIAGVRPPPQGLRRRRVTLPESKSELGWIDADRVYLGPAFDASTTTHLGLPARSQGVAHAARRLRRRRWSTTGGRGRRGKRLHDPTPGFERDSCAAVTTSTQRVVLPRGGSLVKVDKPDDADADAWRQWLLIRLRTAWEVGGDVPGRVAAGGALRRLRRGQSETRSSLRAYAAPFRSPTTRRPSRR